MQIERDAAGSVCRITLQTLPFEGHNHFREGTMLDAISHYTKESFPGGSVAMPNLSVPVTTPELADTYRKQLQALLGEDYPLVIVGYLTEDMDPDTVERGFRSGAWQAMKFYPKGMTTNSHGGVSDVRKIAHLLKRMEEIGMPALFHGESEFWASGVKTDIYDRERAFYNESAPWIVETFPDLRISFEHGSSLAFCKFMLDYGKFNHVVCTVTVHHLLFDRNHFFALGPDVHLHCYPVLKRREDCEALRKLVTGGYDFVFAGTDSAPHPTTAKEKACGCAGGVFTAHAAVELYAEVFEEEGKLEFLEFFLCRLGRLFYFGSFSIDSSIVLEKISWTVDEMATTADGKKVRPLFYHEDLAQRRPITWKRAA